MPLACKLTESGSVQGRGAWSEPFQRDVFLQSVCLLPRREVDESYVYVLAARGLVAMDGQRHGRAGK